MTDRKKLISRVTKLEGDENPYYFNSSKCQFTPQELIDKKKFDIGNSKEKQIEIDGRNRELVVRTEAFLTQREAELDELNAEEKEY